MKNLVYVSKSGIEGKGLFAGKYFDFNEIVFQPKGKILHAKKINWDDMGKEEYDGFLQVGGWEYFDGRPDPEFKYLNHSCNPNMGYRKIKGKVSFVAIKPISKGSEITFDYSTTMSEEMDEEPMPCRCKSKNCRKMIGDFRFLPKEVQNKYLALKIVPSYVLEKPTQKVPMIHKKSF